MSQPTAAGRSAMVLDASWTWRGRPGRHREARRGHRVVDLAIAVLGVTFLAAGGLAAWQTTATVNSGSLRTATTAAQLIDANGGTFSTAVSDLVPGDYFYRYLDVENGGSQASTFSGTVSATGPLVSSLSVAADSCPVAWTTVNGVSTCSSGTVTALGSGVLSSTVTVAHGSIAAGTSGRQHVRYTLSFSSSAPISLQNTTGTVTVAVSNTLVGGRDRTSG